MIGTMDEILLWLVLDWHNAEKLNMSRQRMQYVRDHYRDYSEERKRKWFEAYQQNSPHTIRKVRDRYVVPAVVCDKKGRRYTEVTFVRSLAREKERFADLNLDKVLAVMKTGALPSEGVVRQLLHRKKGWMIEPRVELPSVWEVSYSFSRC